MIRLQLLIFIRTSSNAAILLFLIPFVEYFVWTFDIFDNTVEMRSDVLVCLFVCSAVMI